MSADQIAALLESLGPFRAGEPPAKTCARNILNIVRNRNGAISHPQRAQLIAMGYLEAQ